MNNIILQENIQNKKCHTCWARLMLYNILHNNGYTRYEHSNGPVYWGPFDNKKNYVSITDCSGFINALLKKTYDLPLNWSGHVRPYAITYYNMINTQKYFIKITNINDARIGDFIVFKILPGTSKSDNTGHIMLINNLPTKINVTEPLVYNTLQWSVNIIDQSGSHGTDDTRHKNKSNGLGSGYFRIYTNNYGILSGYSWSTNTNSRYIDTTVHPIVIGRFNL